jgi:2-iminobutanoate/2-iminopropanoate deaminase
MLTAVNPPGAAWPGISQGVILQGKGIFVSSGHMPYGPDGQIVDGDFESQVVAVYEGIGRTLGAAGLGFKDVARVVTYVTQYEPSMVDTIRQVRARYLSQERPPASVLIAAAALYDPRIRIEAEVMAVVP